MDVVRPELVQRKRRRQRVTWFAVAGAALVVVISVTALSAKTPTVDQSDALIETVQRGEFVRAVRGPGRLVPSESRWVIARTDAIVERITLRPGMTVTPNTVILEMSNPDVQDRLLAAEAAYSAAKADHAALHAQMSTSLLDVESSLAEVRGKFSAAKVEEEASRLAFEKGVLSAVQYRQTAIELQQLSERVHIERQRTEQARLNMRAQVDASQARLNQLARTRELRQLEADALRVKAGIDGVVQQISVEEGQRVSAGISLARVARPSTLMAELKIAESQSSDLAVGQGASIEIGRSKVAGTVRRVNPVVEKGTLLVEVELKAPLPAGARTEQSVDGSITTDRIADALFVVRPVNAMPDSDGTVFRISPDGDAHRVPVRFGKDSVNQIQVMRGVQQGDRIIVSDMSNYEKAEQVSVE